MFDMSRTKWEEQLPTRLLESDGPHAKHGGVRLLKFFTTSYDGIDRTCDQSLALATVPSDLV